jgi:hypothetical protein
MRNSLGLNERLMWLQQSIDCGHELQAASETVDLIRYVRKIANNVDDSIEAVRARILYEDGPYA